MVLITEVKNEKKNVNKHRFSAVTLFANIFKQIFCFFSGVLACLDGYMNIALEQTEEYVNGQLKDKYGDAFIRGNNVLYISTQKRRT